MKEFSYFLLLFPLTRETFFCLHLTLISSFLPQNPHLHNESCDIYNPGKSFVISWKQDVRKLLDSLRMASHYGILTMENICSLNHNDKCNILHYWAKEVLHTMESQSFVFQWHPQRASHGSCTHIQSDRP